MTPNNSHSLRLPVGEYFPAARRKSGMRTRHVGGIGQTGTLGKNESAVGKLDSTARKIEMHAVKLDFTVRQNEIERANTTAPISNVNASVSKTSSPIVKIRRLRQTRNSPRQIRIG